MQKQPNNFLALDYGGRRIGLAVATAGARLPRPLTTLLNDDTFWPRLQAILDTEAVGTIVVGLPRSLGGDDTAQTTRAREFAERLREVTGKPVVLQDEAVTSRQAEAELLARGKPYSKGDVDALAATYILEDYLAA